MTIVLTEPRMTSRDGTPVLTRAERSRIWKLSNERDLWLRRVLDAWREGYRAAETDLRYQYAAGFHDGAMALKRAQHETVDEIRLEVARWGPGGREHFADPRPGDYCGGPVAWEAQR